MSFVLMQCFGVRRCAYWVSTTILTWPQPYWRGILKNQAPAPSPPTVLSRICTRLQRSYLLMIHMDISYTRGISRLWNSLYSIHGIGNLESQAPVGEKKSTTSFPMVKLNTGADGDDLVFWVLSCRCSTGLIAEAWESKACDAVA
jgi:hypothetical protein